MATYDPVERDEPVATSQGGRRAGGGRLTTLLIGIAAVAGVAAVGVFAYKEGMRRGAEGGAPVISAAAGPDKVRPAEPGGMQVPNQDKQIYDRLTPDRNQAPQRVERLLPPPEAPMAPPQVATVAPSPPAGMRPRDTIEAPPMTAPAPPPAAAAPAHAPSAQEAAKAAAVAPKAGPATARAYRVQLASVRTQEAADSEVARIKRVGGDALGGLALDVRRVDLGADKGVYYRVQAGPLADAGAATGLCDRLKDRKLGCVVVRP